MLTEIEAKFLDVDHTAIRKRLVTLGATCRETNRLMKRVVMDYPDRRLQKVGGWVRIRDEGDKITLAYKQLNDRSLSGMQEVETTIGDFAKAEALLLAIGLQRNAYQEAKRESWELDGVRVELDEWPWVRSFLEIEAQDEVAVWQVAKKLGLDREEARFGSVEIAYQAEYDVTDDEVDAWEQITFSPIPEWLAAKAKKL